MNFVHDPTEAIEGVLWSYRWGWLTLTDASGLKPSQKPAPMLGDVVIHRSQIKFYQVLP